MHLAQVCLELCERLLGAVGHGLHDEAARLAHGEVGVHEHTHAYRGRNLLALHVVGADVVADLAREQIELAAIRLAPGGVLDDGEGALAHGGRHVELALAVEGNPHVGVAGEALHVALRVGGHGEAGKRAVALDDEAEQLAGVLEHRAHHRARREKPAECRRGDGARLVRVACELHGALRRGCKRANLSTAGRAAHHVIGVAQCGDLCVQFFPGHLCSYLPAWHVGAGPDQARVVFTRRAIERALSSHPRIIQAFV